MLFAVKKDKVWIVAEKSKRCDLLQKKAKVVADCYKSCSLVMTDDRLHGQAKRKLHTCISAANRVVVEFGKNIFQTADENLLCKVCNKIVHHKIQNS